MLRTAETKLRARDKKLRTTRNKFRKLRESLENQEKVKNNQEKAKNCQEKAKKIKNKWRCSRLFFVFVVFAGFPKFCQPSDFPKPRQKTQEHKGNHMTNNDFLRFSICFLKFPLVFSTVRIRNLYCQDYWSLCSSVSCQDHRSKIWSKYCQKPGQQSLKTSGNKNKEKTRKPKTTK